MKNPRIAPGAEPQRLPWTAPDGKTCYVVPEVPGVPAGGPAGRQAAAIADIQLTMAEQLVGHALVMLADKACDRAELRYLGRCLTECLTDVVRLARAGVPEVRGRNPAN
ncbi:hypothetical protein [Streptomyces sp. Je 1-332]|uniref:hypothetical protein n=1 Tax=Streptomyces sp. Je 1-332 TaxID=3231270 RepID=UPI0034577747